MSLFQTDRVVRFSLEIAHESYCGEIFVRPVDLRAESKSSATKFLTVSAMRKTLKGSKLLVMRHGITVTVSKMIA